MSNQEQITQPTPEERIAFLEARVARLEAVVFPQFNTQAGQGQKQIAGDQRRTEAGMGAILNAGSEFI